MLQITNQETIKNCLLTSSFTKTDDCTNTEDNLKSKPQELCTSFICQMKCKLRPGHKYLLSKNKFSKTYFRKKR